MAKLETSISIKDTDAVKTLIELLAQYRDELPKPLQRDLDLFANCKTFEFKVDDYLAMGGVIGQLETDFDSGSIISVNPILKRVRCRDEATGVDHVSFPERFRLGYAGSVFISWGYDDDPNL
jgi:hypothetical protein